MRDEPDKEAALRLFEATFEQDAMGMGIRAADPRNTRWLRVNSRLCEILGYSREELLTLTSLDISHPEDRVQSMAFNERLMRGEVTSYSREKRYIRKDGQAVWTNVWLSAIPGADGTPEQIISVIQDISDRKEAQAIREEMENRFRSVVDTAPSGITLKDTEGRLLIVNRSYASWMNLSPDELIGKHPRDIFPKELAETVQANDRKVLETGQGLFTETVQLFEDGVERTLVTHKRPVFSADGKAIAVTTVHTDITDRVQAEQTLREREERFKQFAESASDWFWETGVDHRFTYLSERFYENTGFDPGDEIWSLQDQHLNTPDSQPDGPWAAHLATIEAHAPFKNFEHGFTAPDGTIRYARMSGTPVFGDDGAFQGYRGTGTDVTESHELSKQLAYQASHDNLTALINRREFERRLARVIDSSRGNSEEHALCYLDLDQFKVINDTCGHMAGDELLRQLGQLLTTVVRKRDTLARLGGDEFGVLMEHCPLSHALRVANAMRETIADFRFAWDKQIFRVGASIGLVGIDAQSLDVADILRVADGACYAAKDEGRNRVHVYRPDDRAFARRHGEMRWVARINQALEDERFRLWWQPIVSTDADEDAGTHFELLLRMVDEEGGIVTPGAFLPAAERYGLSTKLDRWVIGAAFEWLARNPAILNPLNLCAINLSGATLGDTEVLGFIRERFASTGIPPGVICFEITETAAIANLTQALEFMQTLKRLGCKFSLDDFGSGLSSFAYLKTLPVDFLKIDGLFVKDILDDEVDFALVRSINDVGKVMGKKTIAEFVEDAAIRSRLGEIGVDFVQGYALGRPSPVEDLAAPQESAA